MVDKLTNVTSLTRNGLRDWLVQRVSAVVLAFYVVFLLGFILFNPGLDYYTWQLLFADNWMRVFSLLALLSLIGHAWIGMWTIVTDYVKPAVLRLIVQVLIILALIVCLFWGIEILWGIS